MIQKITSEEYLKRYNNTSGSERQSFNDRIGQWLRSGARLLIRRAEEPNARLLNAMQLSQDWNDAEQAAWTEGIILLTAFVGTTDTWLPDMIYTKSAKRSVRRMIEVLSKGIKDVPPVPSQTSIVIDKKEKTSTTRANADTASSQQPVRQGPHAISASKPTTSLVPRPKHIDQYVHLLPEKVQQHAAQYGTLMREIEMARENMRLLANDPHSNANERERWAKLATHNDEKIARINAELDSEWAKLVSEGLVMVDDLGIAHLIPADGKATGAVPERKQETSAPAVEQFGIKKENADAEKSSDAADVVSVEKANAQSNTVKPEKTKKTKKSDNKKKERCQYLKKWLRDTRTSPSDDRRKQWKKHAKELVFLGGEITDGIRKAAEYYSVNLDDLTK